MFSIIISGYRFLYLQLAALVGYGWAIVALSFICSFLMLPLMRAVAGVVRREKEYENVIDPQVAAIKAKYTSDMDRHFHIQRLYARYGYSPLAPIKKVLPLFVQIPFLLLTYYMLKGTVQLSGVRSFGLADLGQPDALLAGVNLLPLVMTGVNILTVFSTPGFSHRDWIQAIAISLLFLVLLYTAPSALLLYWTLNNTITFIRTLCEKRFAGARLLMSRLSPRLYFQWIDARPQDFWAYLSYVLALLAAYMFVMTQYLQSGWRNWYACFYLQNLVIAFAIFCNYRVFRDSTLRVVAILALVVAGIVAVANVVIDATIPFTAVGMKFATQTIPLTTVLLCLFSLWAAPYLLLVRPRPVLRALRDALSANWYLLLLPLALGIHYAFASANFKLPARSVVVLCSYLLAPCLVVAALAVVLFHRFLPSLCVARIALGVVIAVWLLPMVAVENGKLLGYGYNMPVRLLMLALVPMVLLRFKKRMTGLVFVSLLSVVMVINAYAHRTAEVDGMNTATSSTRSSAFSTLVCAHTNNVYLFIYDSYPHQIVLDALGIDNGNLPRFLSDNGFTNYCAYSEGCDTISSMSAMFEVGGAYASPRARMAGNNHFCDFLKRSGYRTSYMLCGYSMPDRGEPLPGDFYFPSPSEVTRPEMVLFPWLVRGCLTQLPNTFNQFTHEEWVAVKRKQMAEMRSSKSFMYAHCAYPEHACVSTANRGSDKEEIAAFSERLALADAELREDIRFVVKHDPNAIVIVASDHGGILVVPEVPGHYDARHLLDRCGILLAIRWPRDYKPSLKLDCLQNVWLEVLIYLSGDTSLVRFEREGCMQPVTHPVKAPVGVVKRGIIQSGPDAGKSLFLAARDGFERQCKKGD